MNIESGNERVRITTLKSGDYFTVDIGGLDKGAIKVQTGETEHFIRVVDVESGCLLALNRDTYVIKLPKAVSSED